MSDIERRRDQAPVPDGPKKINPLTLLPSEEWKNTVGFFFACYSDYLKGTSGLVARFRLWIKEHELTHEEGARAMKKLLHPAMCAKVQYVGQLIALLAEAIDEELKDRPKRRAAEEAKRRVDDLLARHPGGVVSMPKPEPKPAPRLAERFTAGIGGGGE